MNGGNGRAPSGAPTAPRSMHGRGRDRPPQRPFWRICQRQYCGNALDEDALTGVCKPCRRQDRNVVRERQRSQQLRSPNPSAGYAGAGQQPQQARPPPPTAPGPALPPAPLSETEALRSLLAQQMAYNAAHRARIATAAAQDPASPLLQALLGGNQQQQTVATPALSSSSRARSRSPRNGSREQYRQRNDPGRDTTDRRRSSSPRPRDNDAGRRRGIAPSGQANFERRNPEIMDEKPCSWCVRRDELASKAYTHHLAACKFSKRADYATRKSHVGHRAYDLKKDKEVKKEDEGEEAIATKEEDDEEKKVIKEEEDE